MMLTYHISHEKNFSTALYVHGRSGDNVEWTPYITTTKFDCVGQHVSV